MKMSFISDNPIPKGPPDLCFESSAFTKESFSVDQFLQDHRNKANLETMRDDLGIYLKVLRSAMIELINKDYADFVNLSSNLIGLDKAINSIQTPLGQLREELLQVRHILDGAVTEVESQLKYKQLLRIEKQSLRSLMRIKKILTKLKLLLSVEDKGPQLETFILERAISEFNQLQFNIIKYQKQLSKSDQEMLNSLEKHLVSSVDQLFLDSISQGEKGQHDLACSLSFYLMLGKKEEVERLYRKSVIAPIMTPLINEETLRSLPRGLPGLYGKILLFVDKEMVHIREVTKDNEKFPGICEFDFLVWGLWPEVEENLKINLTSIYAAGDPDMFYERYCETLTFLSELGKRCHSIKSKIELHSHPSFISFMERWNLPVYFQIRFQEIVKRIENAIGNDSWESKTNEWKLLVSETVWTCMNRCWENGVFLLPIAYKFWKLSLQIISRFYTWSGQVVNKRTPSKVYSSLDFYVYLHSDIQSFISKLPDFELNAIKRLPRISDKASTQLHQSVEESKKNLVSRLEDISNALVQSLTGDSNIILKQVSDIPRLFRRTNRESPTKPCAYISALLEGPVNFHKKHQSNPQVMFWLQTVFSGVTKQYYNCVGEVLTSVQKTEESLRRLKKARDRSSNITSPNDRRAGDDDKIRLQLLLDVKAFVDEVQRLGINESSIEKLSELMLLVETTQKFVS